MADQQQPVQAPPPEAGPAVTKPCPNCGKEWGPEPKSCQFCGQVQGLSSGLTLSSAGKRLGAYALDGVLAVVTLGIGYLVWMLIVWKDGQSPAKQLLKMRVVKTQTSSRATWGTMCLRDFVGKGIIGFGAAITVVGLIAYFWLLWDKNRQQLWDKIAGTVVVDDPRNELLQASAPGFAA